MTRKGRHERAGSSVHTEEEKGRGVGVRGRAVTENANQKAPHGARLQITGKKGIEDVVGIITERSSGIAQSPSAKS